MRVTFKKYAESKGITIELNKGEHIEYQGKTWQVAKVGKTMCRLTPHGHNELPMWVLYERLFNF